MQNALSRRSVAGRSLTARQSPSAVACRPARHGVVSVRAFKEGAKGSGGAWPSRDYQKLASALEEDKMFCYQCEQTSKGSGCTELGICGKTPEVSALQDLLIYSVKGLGCLAHHARTHGIEDQEVNTFLNSAIFSTLTNVNFDDMRFHEFISTAQNLQAKLQTSLLAHEKPVAPLPSKDTIEKLFGSMPHPLEWNAVNAKPTINVGELIEIGHKTGIKERSVRLGATLVGLQELIVYGLKGMCAYAHHAEALGFTDPKVYAFVAEALTFLSGPECLEVPACLAMSLRVGEVNFRVLQILSDAHTARFGAPTPTSVSLRPKPGKAIVITGHDMHDMEALLEQTKGTGINVYTHGEMLPAHGYPKLHAYPHLAGHFGGAWYRQKIDFAHFPGSILVTTNCVLDPLESYRGNIFTINETGVSGAQHIRTKDFSAVIKRAQELPGFTEATITEFPEKTVTVGFGHKAVLGNADIVVDAVKTGKLEHIFLVGGCDGSEPQRKYYSKLYQYMPTNTMVLTLGCGKFRIFDQDFGMLPGTPLPRLLDMGQCNDSYSALVVATELAKAFNTDINSLPLSLDLSWFEQKAVAVLLTLLHLNVRNIRLGPRIPAFLTAEAVNVLVDKFNLIPADVAQPENDLAMMMKNK